MRREVSLPSIWSDFAGAAAHRLRRWARPLAAAGIAVIVVLGWRLFFGHRQPGDFVVRRGTLEPTIPVVGTLRSERSDSYGATVPGVELKILWLVEEGSLVAAGDRLIQFDPAPFQRELETARARVAELSGEVDGAQLALEALRLKAMLDVRERSTSADASERELSALVNTVAPLSAQESGTELEHRERALNDAEVKLAGLEPFVAEGYVSQEEFHSAQARRDQAAADLRLARARHAALLHQTTPDLIRKKTEEAEAGRLEAGLWREKTRLEVAQAEAAARVIVARWEEASRQMREAERRIAACLAIARARGLAVHSDTFDRSGERRKLRVGDAVWGGTTVVILPDLSKMLVEGKVPESEIHLLSPGEPVRTRLDAFPELVLSGKLRSIGTVGAAEANASRSFPVTIALDRSDPRFRPGMVARCAVLGPPAKDVLFVPIDALYSDESGQYVRVASRLGGISPRRVRTGTSTSQFVEIKDGLRAGDVVRVVGS